jgi:phosphatidylinositol kinase/protein kinase (PI-3  family)
MRPYEILSLAPQAGLVQMVKNATTIDALKRQLHENFKEV